jgi:hypothetical protein
MLWDGVRVLACPVQLAEARVDGSWQYCIWTRGILILILA